MNQVTTYQAIIVETVRGAIKACSNERVRSFALSALGIVLMAALLAAALALRVLVYVHLS